MGHVEQWYDSECGWDQGVRKGKVPYIMPIFFFAVKGFFYPPPPPPPITK